MSIEVVMCFGVHALPHQAAVARAVRYVPSLAGRLLESCDVAVRSPARSLLLRVRLSEGPGAASVVDRLAYWSARAHGFAVALRGDLASASGAVADALQASEELEVAVDGAQLPRVLDRALASLWPQGPCASAAARLYDRSSCASTKASSASRRPRRHSRAAGFPSRSPTGMS